MVMWYWSADTLFDRRQLTITGMSNIKEGQSRRACLCQPISWSLWPPSLGNPVVVVVRKRLWAIPLVMICLWLAHRKFELANQDSAAGKKSSVLTSSKQVRKGFEIRQLFSLEMALNVYEKGFTILKTIPVCKKWKIWTVLAPKMGRRRSAWQLARIVRRASPGKIIVVLFNLNKICCSSSNSTRNTQVNY